MKELFKRYNIKISDIQRNQFQTYFELLTEWNHKMNLTAITEYEEVICKHFLDSALLLSDQDFFENRKLTFGDKSFDVGKIRLLDMGTGAGFPGMVLAVLCPEMQVTLVDSLKKRVDFLCEVVEKLELSNVIPVHGRAEDYGREKDYREQFDIVVSRAVAELPILLEYCIPFVKPGGYFVSYKGMKYREEAARSEKAFTALNCQLADVKEYTIMDEQNRYLLFVQKNGATDNKYPRRAGKPKKSPL